MQPAGRREVTKAETYDIPEKYEIRESVFYIEEEPYLAGVSFILSYKDWCELQMLSCWEQVSDFLAQKKYEGE